MLIAEMRTKFRKRTSNLASDIDDPEVDEFLNRWFQQVIPTEIGGDLFEGEWTQTLTVGQDLYDYPDYLIYPKASSVWISGQAVQGVPVGQRAIFLDVETNRSVFEYDDRYNPDATGQPYSVLFYGRQMRVSPKPDAAYILTIPSRMGSSSPLGTNAGELPSLDNEVFAMAVITGAAHEYLMDEEDIDGATREGASYDYYLGRLRKYAHGKPRRRLPARTF